MSLYEAFIWSQPCARSTQGIASQLIPQLTISNTSKKYFNKLIMKPDLFYWFLLLVTQHDVHDERKRDSKRENKRKESEFPSMSLEGQGERARC